MGNVIYGQDRYLILEKANQLFEKYDKQYGGVEKMVFQTSDANFDIGMVKEAVETVSLFGAQKWVFLFVESEKDLSKISETVIEPWFKLPSDMVSFVLALPKKPVPKSDLRKTIAAHAEEITLTVSGKDAISVSDRVGLYIKKYRIDIEPNAKTLLIERLGTNSARVDVELEKLSLLGHAISLKDVEVLVSYDMQNDIFAFSNALLNKDQHETFRIYHQLLKQKNDPLSLAPLIAASLRSIYQVGTLQSLNYPAHEIRSILNMSEGQFWNVTKRTSRPKDAILDILNALSTFDQESKSGLKDRFVSFELLLLSIMM